MHSTKAEAAVAGRGTAQRARGALRLTSAALGQALRVLKSERTDGKAGVAGNLLRMKTKHLLKKIHPSWEFRAETICGRKVECFSQYELMCTFEVVFVDRDYRFRATTPAPRILDCGSNIGLSVLWFKQEFPEARIVAFEPDPVTFALLHRNVRRNAVAGVELHNLAVGGTPGLREFFHDPANPASVCMSFTKQDAVPADEQVQVARLSQFVDGEVDFLKLDVEGAEVEVLEEVAGSGKLRRIREMVVEVHPGLAGGDTALGRLRDILTSHRFEWEVRSGSSDDGGNFSIYAQRMQ